MSFEPPSPRRRSRAGRRARACRTDQRVEVEALDAVEPIAREQHAVVGTEQTALVHGRQVDPVRVGVEGVLRSRARDADIVVRSVRQSGRDPVGA